MISCFFYSQKVTKDRLSTKPTDYQARKREYLFHFWNILPKRQVLYCKPHTNLKHLMLPKHLLQWAKTLHKHQLFNLSGLSPSPPVSTICNWKLLPICHKLHHLQFLWSPSPSFTYFIQGFAREILDFFLFFLQVQSVRQSLLCPRSH